MSKWKSVLILLLFVAGGIAAYSVYPGWFAGLVNRSVTNTKVEQAVGNPTELLPGPLRSTLDAIVARPLTRAGVLSFTNQHRAEAGLPAVTLNAELNASAEDKLSDMLTRQYFEHVSPTGRTPADVVKDADYQYIVMGENLALGNFKDDQALVQAWMDSPGHRANILNSKFREIGIAVRQGTYEGKKVWLAVQHFGTPLSLCPAVSATLKSSIEEGKAELSQLELRINQLKPGLAPELYGQRKDYVQAVERYNELIHQYNDLATRTKAAIESYNQQIEQFNQCLKTNG